MHASSALLWPEEDKLLETTLAHAAAATRRLGPEGNLAQRWKRPYMPL